MHPVINMKSTRNIPNGAKATMVAATVRCLIMAFGFIR